MVMMKANVMMMVMVIVVVMMMMVMVIKFGRNRCPTSCQLGPEALLTAGLYSQNLPSDCYSARAGKRFKTLFLDSMFVAKKTQLSSNTGQDFTNCLYFKRSRAENVP